MLRLAFLDLMKLDKQIGRHTFDILSVVVISLRDDGDYDVILPHGARVILTPAEKKEYDNAMAFHAQVLQVYGMAIGAGLRG